MARANFQEGVTERVKNFRIPLLQKLTSVVLGGKCAATRTATRFEKLRGGSENHISSYVSSN